MRSIKYSTGIVALILLTALATPAHAQPAARKLAVVQSFKSAVPEPAQKNPHVKYDLDATAEKFAVWMPKDYKEQPGYGLVVFIGGDGVWDDVPAGWDAALKQRKLLFVVPQNASNDQMGDRRMGMAVLAARAMMAEHKIDPKRVYAAGISGGARIAGDAALCEPDLFHGTIQSCGADWIEKVDAVAKRGPEDKTGDDYGLFQLSDDEVAAAKQKVRFTFITGPKDFRHANILDIFHGGFEKAGFTCKLFDVPGMGHQTCAAKQLTAALDFIESPTPPTSPPAPAAAKDTIVKPANPAPPAAAAADSDGPKWAASDPKKWPQILGHNDGELTNGHGIGGSGFLFKLPDGTVVAGTVCHVFGEGTKTADIDKLVKTWFLTIPGKPKARVIVKKSVMTPDPDHPLDCVIAATGTSHTGFEVLTPRSEPVAEGETIYVLGMTKDTKGTQGVFKGTVTHRMEDLSMFDYKLDPPVDTMGFSGAPILDAKGRLVGIHHGHGDQDGHTIWDGIDITAAMKQVTAKK